MTKRFTYVKNNSITQYQALPIQEIGKGKAFHCQGIVDKLNKLTDENEQLKKENNILKASNGEYEDALARLEEENEQLKQENEWLKSEIQKLYNFVKIDVDRNIEVYPKSLMEPILEILKIIGDVE